MRVRRAVLGAVFAILLGPLSAFAQSGKLVLSMSNYPAYSVDVPKEHQQSLMESARALVAKLREGREVGVLIVGHADFDAKGRDFENQVSRSRAELAAESYRRYVKAAADEVGLSTEQRGQVEIVSAGAGTKKPAVGKPASEADRRRNRRVEIYWYEDRVTMPRAFSVQ